MKVSIIVPIYNIAPYVYQCVNSIINQTYKNIEIILVNDGSTDESVYFCEYFKKIDKRVKVIHKENGGLVSARKAGIKEAKGDYVFYVDGDDWLELDCIENYVKEALKNKSDVVIASHFREFIGVFKRMDNLIPFGVYDKEELSKIYPYVISYKKFFRHGIYTYSWGKLYKREIALKFQLEVLDNLTIGEDAAFLYPLLFNIQKLSIIDYSGYVYRHRPNSMLKVYGEIKDEIKKLKVLFGFLNEKLNTFNVEKQLNEYFYYLSLVRSGAFLEDLKVKNYLSILSDIPKNSKIILYNSGSFGQRIYTGLKKSKYYNVVAWADEDHYESQIMNLPVISPFDIKNMEFDYVIIASFDFSFIKETKKLLLDNGISLNKIVDLNRYIDTSKIKNQVEFIKGYYK